MGLYYAFGAAVIILVVIIIYRMFYTGRKDNYDFDSLSGGSEPEPMPVVEHTDFLDKIGKSLGINNFHDVTKHVEELMRGGRNDEALGYLMSNTPLDKERALKIISLFESRFKKN